MKAVTKGMDVKLLLAALIAFLRCDFLMRRYGMIADTLNDMIGINE